MPKIKTNTGTETYPCVARWLEAHGTIEFGYCPHTRSFIRVLDEGGMIWSGQRSYTRAGTAVRILRTSPAERTTGSLN